MLVLGSSSPRRRDILSHYGIPFSVAPPPFDERAFIHDGNPEDLVCRLAEEKGASLKGEFDDEIIMTADTVVLLDGKIYEKPLTMEEAFAMAKELIGKTHRVISGVSLRQGDTVLCEREETLVTFRQLTDEQIRQYHIKIEPLDKAGGYAIQGAGSLIVEKIEGSYENVLGLPMQTVARLLAKLGVDLWQYAFSS